MHDEKCTYSECDLLAHAPTTRLLQMKDLQEDFRSEAKPSMAIPPMNENDIPDASPSVVPIVSKPCATSIPKARLPASTWTTAKALRSGRR